MNEITSSDFVMSSPRAWLVCLTAALFFFYEFIQLNMFNAIDNQVVATFHLTSTQLGFLASASLIANVVFLIPAGLLLDRYSVRKLILFTLGLCILGLVLFSQAQTWQAAWCYRFISGVGSAFCFLSCMRLASRWIHSHHLALATGLIVTMAMLGGMMAQTPLTLLVAHYGWRLSMLFNAMIGVVFLLFIAFIVADFPAGSSTQAEVSAEIKKLGFWRNLYLAFARKQNWLAGLATCLLNMPLMLLGAVWGAPYLEQVARLSTTNSSWVISMLFIGTIVGAPVAGWWSDWWGKRRLPMLLGCLTSLIIVLLVIALPPGYFGLLQVLFFLLGFCTSTQVISYAIVAETNPILITASAVSVVSFTTQGLGALSQTFFGWLLAVFSNKHDLAHTDLAHYGLRSFEHAILIIPFGFLLAALCVFLLREQSEGEA